MSTAVQRSTLRETVELDFNILSTGLLRQIAEELREHEARNRAPLTPGPPADGRPED
jgi:hypothetical protein